MTTLVELWTLMKRICDRPRVSYAVRRVRSIDESAVLTREAGEHLFGTEREQFEQIRSFKRRAEFCAGRIAAKRALSRSLFELRNGQFEIERDALGAPRLRVRRVCRATARDTYSGETEAASHAHLSISHSSGFAVAVAAPRRVGIDLEVIEARPTALLRRFYCDNERRVLSELAGDALHQAVSRFWTRKEAACKMGGWGGTLPLRDIDGSSVVTRVENLELHWRSATLAGFVASLALETVPSVIVSWDAGGDPANRGQDHG